MGKFVKGFRILYQGWLAVLLAIPMILLYPFYRFFLNREDFDRVYRSNRWISIYFSRASLIPTRTEWKGELPDGAYIICANHSSYLDILYLMIPFRQRFVFMGKGEILRWPYFSMFFRSMNIPVPRGTRKVREAYMKAGEALDQGTPIAIFPEGTIPPESPQLGSFKTGAFRLSLDRGVPIVPVTFLDNWHIFPDGQGFWGSIRPGVSRIIVHEAIRPEGKTTEGLSALVRKKIREGWDKAA